LDAGAPIWAIIAFILTAILLWRGPQYLKVVLGYINERHRITGDLERKLKKLDQDLAAKKQKIAAKRARKK
jgi:hypothetical protein